MDEQRNGDAVVADVKEEDSERPAGEDDAASPNVKKSVKKEQEQEPKTEGDDSDDDASSLFNGLNGESSSAEADDDDASSVPDPNRRVKVYFLNANEWVDRGTGFVRMFFDESSQQHRAMVCSEDAPPVTILDVPVSKTPTYTREQDTLIVWTEPTTTDDLALSFQQTEGCDEVYEMIISIQKKLGKVIENGTTEDDDDDDDDEDQMPAVSMLFRDRGDDSDSMDDDDDRALGPITLPSANLSNLDEIGELLSSTCQSYSSAAREHLANTIMQHDYVTKLIDLSKVCRDLESEEHLGKMHGIFRSLVLLNDTALFDFLFADDVMLEVISGLGHDPELPEHARIDHRAYLDNKARFREVIPIRNEETLQRIHQTFRMQYLKDVVLARSLDDPTFGTINSLIFFNNIEIVHALIDDRAFFERLFKRLKQAKPDTNELRELVQFVQEMCNMVTKAQQPASSLAPDTFAKLSEFGLFDVLSHTLIDPDMQTRAASLEIINCMLGHGPAMVRQRLLTQLHDEPDRPVVSHVVTCLVTDHDTGMQTQAAEIIRQLLDSETPDGPAPSAPSAVDEFLTTFYDSCMDAMCEPLIPRDDSAPKLAPKEKRRLDAVRAHLCEILSFCVQSHGYRVRYYILRNNTVARVLRLLNERERYLVLGGIRFFRAVVGMKDDFYNRHIIKFSLFEPIIGAFKANGTRYNVLNSAVIELFEYIRKENIESLLDHVVDHYRDLFASVDYVNTFTELLAKYDLNHKKAGPNGKRKRRRVAHYDSDNDEEAYFDRDSDDDTNDADVDEAVASPTNNKRARLIGPARPTSSEREMDVTPAEDEDSNGHNGANDEDTQRALDELRSMAEEFDGRESSDTEGSGGDDGGNAKETASNGDAEPTAATRENQRGRPSTPIPSAGATSSSIPSSLSSPPQSPSSSSSSPPLRSPSPTKPASAAAAAAALAATFTKSSSPPSPPPSSSPRSALPPSPATPTTVAPAVVASTATHTSPTSPESTAETPTTKTSDGTCTESPPPTTSSSA
eukprot:TRINITY_DN285_c0_g1_i1.p1 TRINITY_DN285_c0_g1~~TRINITY_DN285_c0_g1_i1.p1  ORF type:complete len:1021 (+),score=309.04 TRINITY_DN285_c0_g1_i1:194-3256(+)